MRRFSSFSFPYQVFSMAENNTDREKVLMIIIDELYTSWGKNRGTKFAVPTFF